MRIFLLHVSLTLLGVASSFAQTGGQYGLAFNGSTDDVVIADDASLNPRNEITVEAWIKPESFGSNIYDNSVFCKHNWASGNAGYVLRVGDGGKVSFIVAGRTSSSWEEANSASVVLSTNQWYHIAGTFDGDTVSVYVNGVLQATHLYSGQININSVDARIGEIAAGGSRNFDGDIDEVKVWNQALEVDTIREWMCRRVSKTHPNYKNLAGYWNLNEGSGTTISDESANSNDGKFSGPTWINSGAAVGDTSIYSFNAIKKMSLGGANGEVFGLNNISGAHRGIHLYRLDGNSQIDTVRNSVADLDTFNSWGVYFSFPSSSQYNVNFDYSNFRLVGASDECDIDIFKRNALVNQVWSIAPPVVYTAGDSMTIAAEKGGEYIFGKYGQGRGLVTGTGDSVFCANESLKLMAPGNSSFSFQWYKDGKKLVDDTLQNLKVTTAGKYKADIIRNSRCSYVSNEMTVTTVAYPSVSLNSFSGICESVDSLFLRGGSPSGGVFKGPGVSKDSVFYPSQVKDGTYNIIYTYTAKGGCSNSDTQKIEVYPLPKVKVKGTINACSDKDTIHLSGATPKGGVFSGRGITNNIFYLDSVARKVADYNYTYSYMDANGCSNEGNAKVSLLFATPITFNAMDTSCSNDEAFRIKVNPNQGTYTGTGVNGRNFNPTLAGPGNHDIAFEFKSINGCISTASQVATVVAYTPASFTSEDSICINDDSILMANANPTGGVYSGVGVAAGAFYPSIVGNNAVSYLYIDANGCVDTAKGNIRVLDTASLIVTPISPVCESADALVLSNVLPTGGSYAGSGVMSNAFTAKNAGAGVHVITYLYTNTLGCANGTKFNIEVFDAKDVSIELDENFCANADSFEVTTVKPKGGELSGLGIRNDFFVPSSLSPGTYTVYYRHTDGNNCDAQDSVIIDIKDAPQATLISQVPYCDNDGEITLMGGAPSGGDYFVNDDFRSNIDPTVVGLGEYMLKYVVTNREGCSDSSEKVLRINESPDVPTIAQNADVLTSSAANGNQWYDANGIITGETGVDFSPSGSGVFYVTVTNDSSCTSTSEDVDFIHSSTNQLAYYGIELYPMPASQVLNVTGTSEYHIQSVALFTTSGQQVEVAPVFSTYSAQVPVNHLPKGMYLLKIELSNQAHIYSSVVVH